MNHVVIGSGRFHVEALKAQLSHVKLREFDLKLVVSHAAAVHGIDISPEPADLARIACKRHADVVAPVS